MFKHKEETKKLTSERMKKNWSDPEFRKKVREGYKKAWLEHGKEISEKISNAFTPERRKAYSDRLKEKWEKFYLPNPNSNKSSDKHPAWRGFRAGYDAKHIRVRKILLKKYCERCGINRHLVINVQNRGLALHCVTGNLDDLSKDNWMTLCTSCHQKIHRPPVTVAKERKSNNV
jgi:hypothetical protein